MVKMDHTKRAYRKKINLEVMSDEQLMEFIDSVESEDQSFDSDDSIPDATYVFDNIEPDALPEDDQIIAECIHNMDAAETTDAFLQDINLSMDITSAPSTSASFTSKRARSPLPTAEATGPSVQPNPGGFVGGMHFLAYFINNLNYHCL